jgi:glyoxylase-like metal-dependent hydrolase (beta-lactamase superfamily II)
MDEAARAHIQEYRDSARRIEVTNLVTDGLACDGLTFFYTPGHSPDELCIQYQKVLFTGDHVLPQITPHPSVGASYAKVRDTLPPGYQNKNQYFGLKTFMKSLKRVAAMAPDISVLPAHRAYFHGKFNLTGVERAQEILEHHRERCYDLLGLIRKESDDMESITRRHFSGRHLEGPNFYMAMSEVISHIEFLQEVGDVEMAGKDESQVRWTGSENYAQAIEAL